MIQSLVYYGSKQGRYQVQGLKEDFESLAQLVEYYGVVAIEDGGKPDF